MTSERVDSIDIKSNEDIEYEESTQSTKKYTIEEIEESLKVIVPGLYNEWRPNQLSVIQQVVNSD